MFTDLRLRRLVLKPGKTELRNKVSCWGSAGWAADMGFSEGLGNMMGLVHIQS